MLGWPSLLIGIAAIIAKSAPKKIWALIRSMKFLSSEVALCFYKSTLCPWIQNCCHVWAGAPSCHLEILSKLQKQICRTVDPSIAASLEPLAHHWNGASSSLFWRYSFGRCYSELAQLTHINCWFFLKRFLVCFNHFVLLFRVTPCPVVAVQPCMEWIPIKKSILSVYWCWYSNSIF